MRVRQSSDAIILGLHQAGVAFIVVGGAAAVMQGAPVITEDLDIVHQRTPENVERLLAWLLAHGAHLIASISPTADCPRRRTRSSATGT